MEQQSPVEDSVEDIKAEMREQLAEWSMIDKASGAVHALRVAAQTLRENPEVDPLVFLEAMADDFEAVVSAATEVQR